MKQLGLLSVLCFFIWQPHRAYSIEAQIRQDQVVELTAPAYIFLNHASEYWDWKKSSLDGVQNLLKISKTYGIPSIATVHGEAFLEPELEKLYYISNQNVDMIMHSDQGQHRLRFPKASTIFLGGGNLHVCLCETVRDLVSGLIPTGAEARDIIIVKEAIYDTDFQGLPQTEEELRKFISDYYLPDFPCPDQVATGYGPIQVQGIRFEFYLEDKLILSSLTESTKLIRIRFLSEKHLPPFLRKLQGLK